ncbi:MAG TPA: hypothetical protein VMT37_15100 [Solirubrobacterales bacterium]|nr:hypothetical protein [Solirubrobacterales bacterium]
MAPGRGNPHRPHGRLRVQCALPLLLAAMALLAPARAWAATEDIIAPSDPHNPTVDSGWQAGTCSEEPPESTDFCSVATPDQFFERAAAHPNWGFTQFIVAHNDVLLGGEEPVGELETVRVDLPVGLSVNPGATVRCPLSTFEAGASGCPSGSKVGESEVTAAPPPLYVPVGPMAPLTKVPVYNVIPPNGEPARFGLELAGNEVFLKADVASDGDYHEGFTIAVPKALPLPGIEGLILMNRLVFNGRAGDGTFITTPSTCFGEAFTESGSVYSTYLLAASYEEEEGAGYVFPQSAAPRLESPIPPGTSPKECDTIPYEPTIAVDPGTAATNSPAGAAVAIAVPHVVGGGEQDSSDTKTAQVSLPSRMGINPAAANGLQTCSDAQFGKGTKNPVACPPESQIGTVTIESPPLPEGNLEGPVFVGEQLSRDPSSGNEYRVFVDAESARYGISVRLVGHVRADPVTGQLTTTFEETPQVPFTSFQLSFDGGAHAVLSSPPTCGPNQTTTAMTPWSGNAAATPGDEFELTEAPGGGKCAKAMAERPFAPAFAFAPGTTKAGAFSPLALKITRPDGQQELKGADLTLAPGMTASLAGIPYCSEAALAAAASSAGRAEAANPSCPGASLLGSAKVSAGTGSDPLQIEGKVFLAGPYHGAPLSLAVLTPATAGPFDLGTVVVRVALFVDPETARVRALSDSLPDVYGGTQLSIRSVDLALDRERFALNPTSCEPLASSGALAGGGANPADPASFSSFPVSAPFQTTECDALGFRPKLSTRLFGGRKASRRSGHPKLSATLLARPGDANIRRAAVTLPHSEFLDPQTVGIVCTRPQLAAGQCPRRAVLGHARAQTPLLDDELAGPIYLVPSEHELPDMLVDLHGQVNIRLRGTISSSKARIKTAFETVPDVPVTKFTVVLKGGKNGLLENSRNICAGRNYSFVNFEAQNGKRRKIKKLPLRMSVCAKRNG